MEIKEHVQTEDIVEGNNEAWNKINFNIIKIN